MRRIVVIIALLLVLIAVAIGGLYVATGHTLPFLERKTEEASEPPPAGPVVADVFYYQLKNVMLPAYRSGRFTNYINVNLQLAGPDQPTAMGYANKETRMRDALTREFSRRPVELRGGPTDFDEKTTKARIMAQLREAIGDDSLQDVLILQATPIMP